MIDQILIELLDSPQIFTEGFSNNKRISSSESFEEQISKKLITAGFIDYSDEWEQFKKEKIIKTFCEFSSKREAGEYIKFFKLSLEESTFEAVKMLKPDMGFIEQPLSSKRQPDILIWWKGKDGQRKYLLVDIKTGGGLCPKVNDRPIHRDHLIIFNSRNDKVKYRPTTVSFARDIFDDHDYYQAERARLEFEEWKKQMLRSTQCTIRFNPRARVEICSLANNWFDKNRDERESKAVDFIRRKL